MDVHFSGLARLAASSQHPNGNLEDSAFPKHDLEELSNCFFEIDTESSTPESNRIAYLEQLLRLREPRHLSETQRSGRRFVLDMLRLLCLLPDVQQAQASPEDLPQGWLPNHPFKYLVYLLYRTARPALASLVTEAGSISAMDETAILRIREWLQLQGLDAYELALIQPNFFRVAQREKTSVLETKSDSTQFHPMFAALSDATRTRNHDYLATAFYGASEPITVQHRSAKVKPKAGLEEAMSSIFDAPYDLRSATQTKVKAFFIPNGTGEPLIALSFVNE